MNAPLRHCHPNDPDGIDPDYFGCVAWITVEEVPFAGYAWIWIAQVEVVGTGGEGFRIETIRAGDPWRELDYASPVDRAAWIAIDNKIKPEDVIEAFERAASCA